MNAVRESLNTNPIFDPPRFRSLDYVGRREAAMSFIEDTAELGVKKHDQGVWVSFSLDSGFVAPNTELSCGTAGCLAGWGAIGYGAIPHVSQTDIDFARKYHEGKLYANSVVMPGAAPDEYTVMEDAAAAIFGITKVQAGRLFHENNSVEDLRVMIDRLAEDEHDTFDDFRPSWFSEWVERSWEDYGY